MPCRGKYGIIQFCGKKGCNSNNLELIVICH